MGFDVEVYESSVLEAAYEASNGKNICMVVYRTEVRKGCEIAIYSDVMIEADATYYLIMHSCNV